MQSAETYHIFVVTPSYNQADFLPRTLESVYSQIGDGHYLVADGGSKDASPTILKKFVPEKKNFSYYSHPDGGQVNAINAGITCMCEWIIQQKLDPRFVLFMYLNSDDVLAPGAITLIKQAFIDHCQDWAVGNCQNIDAQDLPIQRDIQLYKTFNRWLLHLIGYRWLYVMNPIPQPSVVIKASAIEKVGLFNPDLKYVMDYEYWLRLWKAVGAPYFSSQTWSHFRIHADSLGTLFHQKQFAEQWAVAKRLGANWAWLFIQKMHNDLITNRYQVIKNYDSKNS